MSAINPVALPPSHVNTDQFSADSANSAVPAAQTDFAGTLQGVAAKPARKAPAGKDPSAAANGGESLPQAGKAAPGQPAAAAPQATAPNPTPAPAPVVAPAKGKQPAKPVASAAPPAAVTPNPVLVAAMPVAATVDTKSIPEVKPQPQGAALPAIAADRGAPLPNTTVPDGTLADPPASAPGAASDPKSAAKQALEAATLFDQATPDPATASAAPAVATPQVSSAAQPPAPPPSAPNVQSTAPAVPVTQSIPAANAAAPSDAASIQASATATVTAHPGKPAAAHAPSVKPASAATAKTHDGGATESRRAEASSAVPSEEGDSAELHAPPATATASSSSTAASADARSTAVGVPDPTQAGPLLGNAATAKAPDSLDNQSPADAAVQGVGAVNGAGGTGATVAANAQSFANLVSETLDKHALVKSDAAGGSVDASGALQTASQSGTSNAPDAPAAAPTFKLGPSVDSSEFGQGVANQVSVMVDSNITSAKLQVSPPALGPIEVRIALQGDHASVQFTSHSAVTREALADSTPKLRDMLTSQGFGQVSVDISHRSFQERPSNAQAYEWGGKADGVKSAPTAAVASLPTARVSRSSVDAYA